CVPKKALAFSFSITRSPGRDALVDAASACIPRPEPGRPVGRRLERLIAAFGPPGAGRVDDRHLPGAGRVEQARGGLDRLIKPPASARVGVVGPSIGEVDDDERRRAAAAEAVSEDPTGAKIVFHGPDRVAQQVSGLLIGKGMRVLLLRAI